MKLINKKTGEIVENAYIRETHDFYNKRTIAVFVRDGNHPPERVSTGYETLAELNAEWEDAPEEPKEYWFIGEDGNPHIVPSEHYIFIERIKEIGNYFASEEEAKRAVEKLKAWKQLEKDLNSFSWQTEGEGEFSVWGSFNSAGIIKADVILDNHRDDLNLLFGGEE